MKCQLKNYVMVNTKKITHERLGSWEKKFEGSHATPILLIGVGHDHVNGQVVICVTEDLTDKQIILFLENALKQLRGL
jgi:hypothetical protein